MAHIMNKQRACKTGAATTCDFEYSGWLTEANHLGNIAYRVGKKLEWDSEKLRCTNVPEADRYIRREYTARAGSSPEPGVDYKAPGFWRNSAAARNSRRFQYCDGGCTGPVRQ